MAVRRQCNRYKTEPFGKDYNDVLKRGKSFFKIEGEFMMMPPLYEGSIWTAHRLPVFGSLPKGAIVFAKENGRWHKK